MTPTFTVLIGSAGRDTLEDSLRSIERQRLTAGDHAIVAFDSFERDAAWIDRQVARVQAFGPQFHGLAYNAGYHWYGVEQINYALRTCPIQSTHVLTIGDDDVFCDGAYGVLREACAPDLYRPVLYQFVAPWRDILPSEHVMQRSRISGCCIAAPRSFVGPMPTRQYVEHDYDWMLTILSEAARAPIWLDRVLVIARPDVRNGETVHRGVSRCFHCRGFRWIEDVALNDPYCPWCHAVIDVPGVYPRAVAS